ncbi:MAG: DNA repair protein RecN [Gammaproteobacteria bacterium]|nr:DNA repair protein RecN [Gammaproteobacteria bacterium]MDH4254750.1 DNA repair protein RecN [Gammaproteobacteria bacterium]
MLRNLQVRNFAIIDQVDVEFGPGMTVLTGETGAGKSILVDALGLVLGERGGSGLLREGAKRAEFSAEFDLSDQTEARQWLVDQALEMDDECVLRRVIGDDGRSRAFINGNAVSMQSLKALGELILDIHGQHFHQSLGRPAVQRDLLDFHGGLLPLRTEASAAFERWQSLRQDLEELEARQSDRESRLELLQFQVSELDALDLQPDELRALRGERDRLQNLGRLSDGVGRVLEALYDGDETTAQAILAGTGQTLAGLAAFDDALDPARQLLDEASIQVAEAVEQLRRYGESLEADPARRDWVEDRLDAIQSLARKHRVEADNLGEIQSRLRDQLDELRNFEERSGRLGKDVESAERDYRDLAGRLSEARRRTAESFASNVTAAMAGLGMPGGRFEISFETRDIRDARAWGMDRIDYLISANPGQAPQPLARIASGGELSRMSLAIQVVASGGSRIPTMVFDEVDSGVGGGVAEMVGRRLCELGADRQVLCVTHLPQVASQADNHIRVIKITDGKTTRTGVSVLNRDERIEELARMLGGVKITQRTREHAAEMLAHGGRKAGKATRATR